MRNRPRPSWLSVTLGLSASVAATILTLSVAPPAWAQQPRQVDIGTTMSRARAELATLRQRLERATRAGELRAQEDALAAMKKVIDDVTPAVQSFTGDVAQQQAILREYEQWRAEYANASGNRSAQSGEFFLMMSQRWAEISAEVTVDPDEHAATLADLVADPSVVGFGMPKTLAGAQALDRYLVEIQAHPDYRKNRTDPNVVADLANARKARAESAARLADAADGLLVAAAGEPLDQPGRDRVVSMLRQDIPDALAGSPRYEEVAARARAMVWKFDQSQDGSGASAGALTLLTELGDEIWPEIAGRYPSVGEDPIRAGRGDVIQIRAANVVPPTQYAPIDADLVLMVNGRPVVCVFDPVVKQHVKSVLAETKTDALPEKGIDVIGVVRGLASVDMVQKPGSTPATTNPAAGEGEASPITTPTLAARDGVTIDVLAIHAGPAAIGVDPTPGQAQGR